MSFNFGSPTSTSGSTFGTATGFAFGSGDASKSLFGNANTENKPAFNFSNTTTSAPAFSGFSLGAKTVAATSSLSTTTTSSVFGANKPLSFGGFTSPPNQTVGSPGFGQPVNQNPAQNLSFGASQQQQPAPAFGTPTTQASSGAFGSPNTGLAFGKPTATSASSFGFNTPASGFSSLQTNTATSPAQQTTQAGFGGATNSAFGTAPTAAFGASPTASAFGTAPTASAFGTAPTASAFGTTTTSSTFGATSTASAFGTTRTGSSAFGTATTASAFGSSQPLSFGSSSFAAKPGFSFGGAATTASTATTATPGFGAMVTASAAGQQATPVTQQQGLGFGTTTGLSFGTSQPTSSAAPSFGTASGFQAPTGLGFGTTTTSVAQATTTPQAVLSFGTTTTSSQPILPSFGQATSQSSVPTFGTATSQPTGLGFGTPTTSQTTGLSFGTPTTSQTTGLGFGTPTTTSQPTGLSFGTPTTSQPAALSFGTPATTSQTSGFSLPTSQPAPGLIAATTASQPGLSFGTTTTQSTGLSFGSTVPSTTLSFTSKPLTTTTSTASTTAPSGITALGKSTAASTAPSLTTVTTTTASVPPPMITSISFAQLEENINKWTLELEEQEKTFINQATQINAWDRLLIANGEKIVELNEAVQTVTNEQQSLEHELEFVSAQQKELEDLLAPMEKQLLEDTSDRLRDPEREHMYSLAENLDTQLRQMSEDLKEVIEHLNETNRSQDSNDPIVQIGRILNAHMSSMQWVDNSIAQISTKLDQLKATHDTLRRDNERSFQLTYN